MNIMAEGIKKRGVPLYDQEDAMTIGTLFWMALVYCVIESLTVWRLRRRVAHQEHLEPTLLNQFLIRIKNLRVVGVNHVQGEHY